MSTIGATLDIALTKPYLKEYLQQRGLPLRQKFHCLNPEHPDAHPSMSYNARAENVHCFSCGATYDLLDLIGMDYGLVDVAEQYRKACELFRIDEISGVARSPKPSVGPKQPYLPMGTDADSLEALLRQLPVLVGQGEKKPVTVAAPSDRAAELEAIRAKSDGTLSYLTERGLSPELCARHGLFQAEDRVYFPVREAGRVTGWCARALTDGITPRYRNSKGELGLWNGDLLAADGKGRTLFVTEGIMDALCLEELGQQAVALCGSQNTGKLLRRLERDTAHANSWNYVVCGDNDDAGRAMNEKLLQGLAALRLQAKAFPLPPAAEDIAALYQSSRLELRAIVQALAVPGEPDYGQLSAAAALDTFFRAVEANRCRPTIATGFPRLDKALDGGLYPGLYVLGAISSLGKTSFLLQMADSIAATGRDVLFFSLEQSRHELMAKSLSRYTALHNPSKAWTTRQLLSGGCGDGDTLNRARRQYEQAGKSLFIKESIGDTGVEEIRRDVAEHRRCRGVSPVVFVDYLQILAPVSPYASDKQNTDKAVIELKKISRDFETPVVAVSSFNRDNYRNQVTMEAFKESGAVEYSSDVLLGMQLAGIGARDFDVNAAKKENPRRIEVVLLKNRNGAPYARLPFAYDARFNLF
ncbi:toprim domain-containing protein, partial [Ruminococcaceae bacterium OttesenSCG-928-L11]|nr:toprim domain-containing protein [Ruminococcaceae bacterium OttesenSCG-928-L11]